MKMINRGEVIIGRLTTRAQGVQVVNHGTTTIDEHVCLSGQYRPGSGTTHIKTRYVPPGSTCVCYDDDTVTVDRVVRADPPPGDVKDPPTITVISGKHDSTIGL